MIIISAILFCMQTMMGSGTTTSQTTTGYDTGSSIVVQDQSVMQ